MHKANKLVRSSAYAYVAGVLTCLCLCYAYACACACALVRTSLNNSVVPNSNPLGIKRFASGISISFKCECHITMQIQ